MRGAIACILACSFLWICVASPCLASSEPMLPARASAPATPLLPYLDYFIDESGDMDIAEAAAPDFASRYRPLALKALPNECGVMWLRFTLGALPEGARPQTLLLDMGESVPGVPILYEPESNAALGTMEWREVRPSQRNVLLLPEAGANPLTCYLRIEGLPGIWFAPTLRTPQDAADNWASFSRMGAILALGVVMLLCLLRAFSENGQWRIWTALYVATALLQALAGMPETGSGHVAMQDAAALMLPGVALMLLPHVGRHLMRWPVRHRGVDWQLVLLSLPGAGLALLPLLPTWLWLGRWLALWPLGCLIFVPTALAAWFMGIFASRRFLVACLLPPLATGVAIGGIDFGWPANVLASLPMWGVALSALILATGRAPASKVEEVSGTGASDGRPKENDITDTPSGLIELREPLASQDRPLDSPARGERRKLQPEAGGMPLLLSAPVEFGDPVPPPPAFTGASGSVADTENEVFDLQKLLRQVHDDAVPEAEKRGVGLAWSMPPQLSLLYRGNAQRLQNVLEGLLASSLAATRSGAIHISVRRLPGSPDAGQLLFTISDSGTGLAGRSSEALIRACNLAASCGGDYVGLECSATGATLAFTARFSLADEEGLPADLPLVIMAAETEAMARTLAYMLRKMPCRVRKVTDLDSAMAIQAKDPAFLLVAQGSLASVDYAPELGTFAELAARSGLPFCKRLAITVDRSQWAALGRAGFTHALEEPVEEESLRVTVGNILEALQEQLSSENQEPEAHLMKKDAQEAEQPEPIEEPAQEGVQSIQAAAEGVADAIGDTAPAASEGEVRQEPGEKDDSATMYIPPKSTEPVPAYEEEGEDSGQHGTASGVSSEDNAAVVTAEVSTTIPESARRAAEEEQENLILPETASSGAEEGGMLPKPAGKQPEQGALTLPAEEGNSLVDTLDESAVAPKPEASGEMSEGDQSHKMSDPELSARLKFPEEIQHGSGGQGMETEPGPADPGADSPSQTVPPEDQPELDSSPTGSRMPMPEEKPNDGSRDTPPQPGLVTRRSGPAAKVSPQASGPGYVSHHLASPGEWVGEPMPLGTQPMHGRKADPFRPRRAEAARGSADSGTHGTASLHAYESPSVRQPGEWVGEPMPLGTPLGGSRARSGMDTEDFQDFIAPPEPAQRRPPLENMVTRLAETAMHVSASQVRARPEGADDSHVADAIAGQAETDTGAGALDPELAALLQRLDEMLARAQTAYGGGYALTVAEAASQIRAECENFGLDWLGRMAACVEQAARARDLEALSDLLPELSAAVERNRIALTPKK